MTISIHQPNFLPWLGFFNKIYNSDVFVILDDVQFPRGHSFGNRVLIKTHSGAHWITVPVLHRGYIHLFNDIEIQNQGRWKEKLLKTFFINYNKTTYFNDIFNPISEIINSKHKLLIDLNYSLLNFILNFLEIKTKIVFSSSLNIPAHGEEKILEILNQTNATEYISGTGSGSKRYIDQKVFESNGIRLTFQDFLHPVYHQLHGEFIARLSIIDLIFNCGKDSLEFIK